MFGVGALILGFYVVWFLLSVGHQLKSNGLPWNLKKLDVFNVIPGWRFFGPKPVKNDYFLLYRDKIGDEIHGFEEIILYENSSFVKFIFNPTSRIKKTFLTVAQSFTKINKEDVNPDSVILSLGYITVLTIVNRYKANGKCLRQFVVLRSKGFSDNAEPEILIASEFHEVE